MKSDLATGYGSLLDDLVTDSVEVHSVYLW
jgi:hypothetical protein